MQSMALPDSCLPFNFTLSDGKIKVVVLYWRRVFTDSQGGIIMSKKLGNLVKEARTAKGMTQAALADYVGGITSSDVSKIERGEKEPTQDILKKMAKVLGVTQKSLLDAATGAKTTTSAKTSGSAKTGAKKKTSSTSSSSKTLTLTATEKKLVELYRKADSSTKKAAMNLLKGEGNALELFGTLLTGKNDVSSMAGDLLGSLLSGKGSGTSKGPVIPEEEGEENSQDS